MLRDVVKGVGERGERRLGKNIPMISYLQSTEFRTECPSRINMIFILNHCILACHNLNYAHIRQDYHNCDEERKGRTSPSLCTLLLSAPSLTPLPAPTRVVMTLSGERCVFPFVHEGTLYWDCAPHPRLLPFCPTTVDRRMRIVTAEYCTPDYGGWVGGGEVEGWEGRRVCMRVRRRCDSEGR